jgi:hypothetical protein
MSSEDKPVPSSRRPRQLAIHCSLAPLIPAVLAGVLLLSSNAHAYAGQQLLEFAGSNIVGPLGIFAIVGGTVAAKFRPELASRVWGAAIACVFVFVFFFIRFAPSLISAMSS